MTREGDTISTGKAVLIGMIWVNGTAMLGLILPGALAIALATTMKWSPGLWVALGGPVATALLCLACGWVIWASQITRWRLWAYRRVEDVAALKTAAVGASLIWPDGHPCERTEFRTRDQAAELARLEQRSPTRVAEGRITPPPGPTALGTAGRALLFGLMVTPLCVLAPAGLLGMVGVTVTDSPIYLAILLIFPLALAVMIYRRARKEGVSADEGFRRMLPAALRAKRDGE